MSSFAATAVKGFSPEPQDDVMESLFQQYERVIFESLITSFGLDIFIKDRHGGDVDTIHNVRQIGTDPKMTYKNVLNEQAYDNRGDYDYNAYHDGNETYRSTKHDTKKEFQDTGTPVTDAYTGKKLYFYSKGAAKGNGDKQASIDHVLTAHTIHEDRGRVLSGLSGEDLANAPDNLVFTNASLNSSMGASKTDAEVMEIPEYIEHHPELPEDVKQRMMGEYQRAKKNYEAKLARAYYTSPKFIKDSALAAGSVGVKMGIRQVLGFVFAEIWFEEREILRTTESPLDLGKLLHDLGEGVKRGVDNARKKYKELIQKFEEGAVAGVLSSLTTTLCNIFFTTAKRVVRIIRQSYASLVQAMNVLFLNPDNYLFGDRIRAVAKILATGASVVVGVIVSEVLEDTGIGKIPVVGEIITTFCGSLVTGLMSCSLLYFLDRSKLINDLVRFLNGVTTVEQDIQYYMQQAEKFKQYAAELMKIDLKAFQEEVDAYDSAAKAIDQAATEDELNQTLHYLHIKLGIKKPWKGEFSTVMQDRSQHLVFE